MANINQFIFATFKFWVLPMVDNIARVLLSSLALTEKVWFSSRYIQVQYIFANISKYEDISHAKINRFAMFHMTRYNELNNFTIDQQGTTLASTTVVITLSSERLYGAISALCLITRHFTVVTFLLHIRAKYLYSIASKYHFPLKW